ncbi:hypothetical protein P8C59_006730 [Phyllachora maydis]|uniref:Uncharacterized protein n=1 Tax=Phyllachora maydis TaxID=1825666 RepID=A0AAD9I7F1_9PEZI|nr:hypothetical protein P8C59_006730 [Phyllachora maydis]
MAAEEHHMPFIRNLASSNRKLRTASLDSLRAFLAARQAGAALPALAVLQLWKGLFYAVWMCDGAVPQQALCDALAGPVLGALAPRAVAPWLRGFWATMAREWAAVDARRLDKFMLLVRRLLGASFAWMRRAEGAAPGRWDVERTAAVLALLADWPLAREETQRPTDPDFGALAPPNAPVGLKLHVLDIWVDEAEKAGLLDPADEQAQSILRQIIDMVDELEKATTSPAVRKRCKESLADDRLPGAGGAAAGAAGEMADAAEYSSWDGFED